MLKSSNYVSPPSHVSIIRLFSSETRVGIDGSRLSTSHVPINRVFSSETVVEVVWSRVSPSHVPINRLFNSETVVKLYGHVSRHSMSSVTLINASLCTLINASLRFRNINN